MELTGLSEKIFLDRYAIKDIDRHFQVGDKAIVLIKDDPKWSVKEVGVVEKVEGDILSIRLTTGPDAGEIILRPRAACDRPVEKSLPDAARRIAHGIAAVEEKSVRGKWERKFETLISELKYVPAGRIWTGAGTGQDLTFFNCYVIPSPKDTRHGIFQTLDQMVEIMSRGGGVGINVSTLRPRNAVVRGVNGRSSGASSWMDIYSRATGLVQQGGSRRGALMIMMWDWHPDIFRFIDSKKTPGMVENANVSVCVSDDFMSAIQQDADWDLVFPDTTDPDYLEVWDGNLSKWKQMGKAVTLYQTVKARDLWNRIIEAAWASAEPGVVFMDRYQKESNSYYYSFIQTTNPCVTGDTLIPTVGGLRRARDLAVENVPVRVLVDGRFGGDAFASASPVFLTGVKPVYRLETREGYSIRLTADHRVYSEERGWVPAQELLPGEQIRIANRGGAFGTTGNTEEGRVLGWLVGDGHVTKREAVLSLYHQDKEEVAGRFAADVNAVIRRGYQREHVPVGLVEVPSRDLVTISSTRLREVAESHGLVEEKLRVPEAVFTGCREMQAGFLQALFEADGHVENASGSRRSIRLTSVSLHLLEDVQQLLLNFGIYSRIYRNRKPVEMRWMPGPDRLPRPYTTQASHQLVISGKSMHAFANEVGFLGQKKMETMRRAVSNDVRGPYAEKWLATVVGLNEDGMEPVYDLTEPRTHSFVGNGVVVHNCGEQGLPDWAVCNLGHINLSRFFNKGEVDWDSLREAVHTAVRFQDDVIDATPYHFEENRNQQMSERRVGLGSMGLGELLIRLGMRYGSAESVAFCDRLYGFIAREAYLASVDLAKEKGAFPHLDAERFLDSGFMRRMPEDVRRAVREHGIRNVTILTQAPTGTVGTMVDTSTGIEPFYAMTYYRQSRLGTDEQYVRVAEEWLQEHPGRSLPGYFVGAMDLTPEEHIRIQAAVQRWTDSSISKTCNAPNSYTVEDTRRLYELAYELGAKGVTLYRDGSRYEQVLTTKETEAKEPQAAEPVEVVAPRPDRMTGKSYVVKTHFGTMTLDIHEHPVGEPFEIFINVGPVGSDLLADAVGLGRTLSLLLRLNSPVTKARRIEEAIDKLKNIGGAGSFGFGPNRITSLASAVAKGLELYLADRGGQEEAALEEVASGTEAHHGPLSRSESIDLCPSCGSHAVVKTEGCRTCQNCGFSAC